MDWMLANVSTTAQRGALDWRHKFRDAVAPLYDELYDSVAKGNEAKIVIDAGQKSDYRKQLELELKEMRESEIWQVGEQVRKLRPE
jgi:ketol-acid reductoisomerase